MSATDGVSPRKSTHCPGAAHCHHLTVLVYDFSGALLRCTVSKVITAGLDADQDKSSQ